VPRPGQPLGSSSNGILKPVQISGRGAVKYQFGPYQVDDEGFQLTLEGRPVALEPKALQLLLYCVRHPGRLLRKQELLDQLWSDATVGDNALTRCVAQVRKALHEDSREPRYIATVPTVGYRFLAEVAVAPAVASVPGAAPSAEAESLTPSTALPSGLMVREETEERVAMWRSPLAIAMIAAGGVLLGVVAWLGWQRYQDHVGGAPVQVVVADFDGGTGDPVLDRTLQDVLRFELLQSPFVAVVTPGAIRGLMTQMRHDPSERLTPELAREVCERTGSQAVLHGSLVRLGNRFVMVEEATSCADNATIGTAKQNVGAIEDLPAAVGKMAAVLRHDMGESRRMIARFNRPLSPQNTNSLEALKEFSQASYLNNLGKNTEAVDLLKRAVALDPKFAAAYFNLYSFSFSIMNRPMRMEYLKKAYELREFATEPTQLAIAAYYEGEFTGDLDAVLRDFQTWTDVYPRDLLGWKGLANVTKVMDLNRETLAASKHALELDPDDSMSYYMVATAQTGLNDYAGARNTCETALSKGMDTELIHRALLFLGHVTHDAALIVQQETWAETHPPSPDILLNEAYFALLDGRATAADGLFVRAAEAYRQQGDADLGAHYRQGAARTYFELGWPNKAQALLNSAPIPTSGYSLPDDLVALAETGRPELAESLLRKQLADLPQSTRWLRRYGPDLRATIALLQHRPADALAVTEGLKGADLEYVAYPLGLAYMQTNQLPQAEAQFRTVLEHPGVDPTSDEVPLAQLQMARVLAKEGRHDEAIRQYRVFLTLWKDADKESPTLRAAQAELSALHKSGV
jgi:DNA-binding winged helix-turn-helix (wHTH) protein/tetratricopeptide (TPR) repeat protein